MLLKTQGVVRIATDIELRYLESGKAVARFSVVSSDKYKTQSGEQKEETCFINCVCWGKLGEILNQYCKKGSQIYIDGKIKQENWTDQNGGKRSKHSITIENMTMLDSQAQQQQYQPPQPQPRQQSYQPQPQYQQQQAPAYEKPSNDIPSADIPF
jgi:single-strand DNA-binding protein